MAGVDLDFACTCGTVHGKLRDITARSGTQLQCHCDDCRRAVIWLGQTDPGADGVRYYQTTPARTQIDAGTLKAFTWKNEKLLRWYAPCCNTAMFNTLNSPKWAFSSVAVACLKDQGALGPVTSHAFVLRENGKRGHDNMLGFMLEFLKRVIGARLSGSWRNTPFFDASGAPVVEVQALTHKNRATAQIVQPTGNA